MFGFITAVLSWLEVVNFCHSPEFVFLPLPGHAVQATDSLLLLRDGLYAESTASWGTFSSTTSLPSSTPSWFVQCICVVNFISCFWPVLYKIEFCVLTCLPLSQEVASAMLGTLAVGHHDHPAVAERHLLQTKAHLRARY